MSWGPIRFAWSLLGGGTIYRREKGDVEGLTTAASLLMASGIGAAVALGQ